MQEDIPGAEWLNILMMTGLIPIWPPTTAVDPNQLPLDMRVFTFMGQHIEVGAQASVVWAPRSDKSIGVQKP